jgi:hypothetical protein
VERSDSSFLIRLLHFGLRGSRTSGYPGRVSEYTVFDNGARPSFALDARGRTSSAVLDVMSTYAANDDQRHEVRLQLPSWLTARLMYDRLRHWLDHDPLAYGVEVEGLPPTRKVTKVDLDPLTEYRLVRSVMSAHAEATPLGAHGLSLRAGIRTEARDGNRQAIGFSMCQTCHLAGRERILNMRSNDYTMGATVGRTNRYVRYTFDYGDFREQHRPPENYYGGPTWNPDPTRFATWPPAPQSYTDKLVYAGRTLPYDVASPTERFSHRLRASVPIGSGGALVLSTNHVVTRNQETGVLLISNAGHAAFTGRPLRRTTLLLTYGVQRLDNDDVLSAQRRALAPYLSADDPYAPTADQYTNSALTRTVQDVSARAVRRFGRSTNLILGTRWKSIDRDHFDLGSTRDASVQVALTTRAVRGKSFRVEYVGGWTDNPFQNPRAGREDPPDTIFINQLYSRFNRYTRVAPLSIAPTERHEMHASWYGNSGRLSYSLGAIWRLRTNDETGWKSRAVTPTLDLTYATGAGLAWSASYSYQRERGETLFSAPDMLLKAGQLAYHHGSFYRMIPYREDAHVLATSASWPVGPRVTCSASASYTRGKGIFDTSQYVGRPDTPDGDLIDLRDLNQFSGHDETLVSARAGLDYDLDRHVVFNAVVGYERLANARIYLRDVAGQALFASVGVSLTP